MRDRETAKTETPQKTAGRVEILNPDYLVVPGSERDSRPPIRAVLALVDGRRIARWAVNTRFGPPALGYAEIAEDAGRAPTFIGAAHDEMGGLVDQLENAKTNPRGRAMPLEPSLEEIEVARFAREYPIIAETLKLSRIRPKRLFEPGPTWRPPYDPRLGSVEVDWAMLRDRHCSGDHGALGQHDPAPLDEATIWLIGLADQATRNRHAIATGRGIVRSVFPVEGRPGVAVHVATALGSFTHMTIAVPNF